MSEDGHKAISENKEFCSVRADGGCACGNDHRKLCKPGWAGKFKFRVGEKGTQWGEWEAHHILSISCVNWLPKGNTKQKRIIDVLDETTWCINAKRNMIAMPKFGHTIMYYVDIMKTAETGSDEYIQIKRTKAPAFKNLPQHDFEHNTKDGYCFEVKTDIKAVWDEVAGASKAHKIETADWLVSELNQLSSDWRTELKSRGKRHGGTHSCWTRGRDDGFKNWYVPFSMATKAAANRRNHPMKWDPRSKRKMDMIWDAMCDAGVL